MFESIIANNYFLAIAAFLTAFGISFYGIPKIITIAKLKNLHDEPNGRTSHINKTPTLGGVAIFASFLLSSLLFIDGGRFVSVQYLVASITIMFFLGIKDDILVISPKKKLLGQIIAALILIILGDIRFKSLNGFQDIHEIPYLISVFISLFIFIVIINCMNLIDGVDGLASGLAILSSFALSLWFYVNSKPDCLMISICLLGSLIPFFIYNVFGKKNKLFMGDTGSLIIGLISCVMIINFNEFNTTNHIPYRISSAPAICIAILFVPLYDTLQVFVRRIVNGKSPFKPDRNHTHHKLLNLGLTHIQTTIVLITLNFSVIVFSYFVQHLSILTISLLLLVIGVGFTLLLDYLNNSKRQHKIKVLFSKKLSEEVKRKYA